MDFDLARADSVTFEACLHSALRVKSLLSLPFRGRINRPFHIGTGRAQQRRKVMKTQGAARARQAFT